MVIRETFLTAREVAEILKLNILTVYDYIRTGQLPAVKFGRTYRITEDDLEMFIRGHRTHTR
jgi:excisionase family DNA binding protein